MGIRLFVGGHAHSIQGELVTLRGDRCFTAVHPPPATFNSPEGVIGLLDSGAFSDPPHKRLTPERALDRQLRWEQRASDVWSGPWISHAVVSYDLLIDEVWTNGIRAKRRWSVAEAERAVRETVDAAAYLASRREELVPRRLVLSCQGVDAEQYGECAAGILQHAGPDDWIGFGGWCILGRWQSWLSEFVRTCQRVLPAVRDAGVGHVHIFGVLWLPALGALLWLADHYGLTVSTDSTAPLLAVTRGNHRKAGARLPYWRDNVEWWINRLATLRESPYYRAPQRNMTLWEAAA